MRLNALIFLLAVALTVVLSGYFQAAPPAVDQTPAAPQDDRREPLPSFTMTALDGTPYRSGDFVGKAVLLNFWASWCAPCVAEFPALLELAALYPDTLVLLAVSADRDRDAILKFTAKLDPESARRLKQDNVIIVWDEGRRIGQDIFQTVLLPETILAAPDLTMAHKFAGADWTVADMREKIDAVLGSSR